MIAVNMQLPTSNYYLSLVWIGLAVHFTVHTAHSTFMCTKYNYLILNKYSFNDRPDVYTVHTHTPNVTIYDTNEHTDTCIQNARKSEKRRMKEREREKI